MRRKNPWCLGIILFIAFLLLSELSFAEVRKSAVAGKFYPEDKKVLRQEIQAFLDAAPKRETDAKFVGLVLPHAGIIYSGKVAAYGYKIIKDYSSPLLVIIAPAHYDYFDGISIGNFDSYETPLGKVKVAKYLAKKLLKTDKKIIFRPSAHEHEHAIEVHLPFIQVVSPKSEILPIIVGNPSLENCKILARALIDIYHEKPEAIFILSSDLSHYHSAKIAKKMDALALETIAGLDVEKFMELYNAGTIELCGSGPVLSFMLAAPFLGVNDSEILSYSHSGESDPEMEKVVGYGAVAFTSSKIELSEIEKKDLLMIARETIMIYLKDKKIPKFKREDPNYTSRRGVFVTLTKEGRLRGCIGYIYPFQPLLTSVQEMAVAAATKDMRFSPLESNELKECKIEISILSNLYPLEKLGVLEIGRDGLYIRYKGKTGILLPQVAEELNLSKEEFLEQVSLKAGLPKDTWKDKDSQLFYFSVEKFKEH